MTRRQIGTLVAVALTLTACGGTASQPAAPTNIPPTSAPARPPAQPATASLSPVADPPTATSESVASSGDVRTYRIVPDESTVSYSVDEVLIREGNKFNIAVGTTSVVEGAITLNFSRPELSTVGTITVDISTFKSDSGRRDRAIRDDWLESASYPIATFTPTQVVGIPIGVTQGDEITFQITGDLHIRETTRPVTWEVTAKLDGEMLTGAATTTIRMSDFNFSAPDIAGILKAENEAKLEFKFVARP